MPRHSSLHIMKVTWVCNFSYLPLGNKRNLSQINLIMIFTVQYIRYIIYALPVAVLAPVHADSSMKGTQHAA